MLSPRGYTGRTDDSEDISAHPCSRQASAHLVYAQLADPMCPCQVESTQDRTSPLASGNIPICTHPPQNALGALSIYRTFWSQKRRLVDLRASGDTPTSSKKSSFCALPQHSKSKKPQKRTCKGPGACCSLLGPTPQTWAALTDSQLLWDALLLVSCEGEAKKWSDSCFLEMSPE